MGWVTPPTFAAGDTVSAADWNQWVQDNLEWCEGSAALRLTSTEDLSLSSFVRTEQPLNVDALNSEAGAHSPIDSTSRITIRTPGLWSITATAESTMNSSFDISIMLNGTCVVGQMTSVIASTLIVQPNVHVILGLRSGDQISMALTCGVAATATAHTEYSPVLTAVRLGEMLGSADPEEVAG